MMIDLIDYCLRVSSEVKSVKFRTTFRSEGRLEELIQATDFLPPAADVPERVYCTTNKIKESPRCYCGARVEFNKFSQGYRAYCSVKCSSNSDSKKADIAKTNLEKFGHENAFHSPEGREAFNSVSSELRSIKGKASYLKLIEVNGGQHPMKVAELARVHKTRDAFIESYIAQGKFDITIDESSKYDSRVGQLHRCLKCDQEFYRQITKYTFDSNCPACSKYLSSCSVQVSNYIKELGFNPILEKKIHNSRKGTFDIVVEELRVAIEVHGVYWHCENSRGNSTKEDHLNKLSIAKESGYSLIQILDSEWNKKQHICKSIIKSKLGKIDTRIFARKCLVKILDVPTYRNFLDNNHLQGYTYAKYRYGLYYKDELVLVMSFSERDFTGKKQMELVRLASKLNTSVVGGASRLFKYFIGEVDSSTIISYADRRYSEGKVYEGLGFAFEDFTKPNYYYTKNYVDLESRYKYQKHKLGSILPNFDPSLTEWENMKNNKFDRLWDCGHYLFKWHRD